MPAAVARRATDLHRTAQARISASVLVALVPLWRILDIDHLDERSGDWLAAAAPVVRSHHAASSALAAAYFTHIRGLELPAASPAPTVPAPVLDEKALATSLLVTGPIAIKAKLAAGMPLSQAVEQAFAGSSSAAARHALSGGRDFIQAAGRADERATGLVRVTSPGACEFCQTIADYSETNPALLGDFQCHDGCHCQPEPVFT